MKRQQCPGLSSQDETLTGSSMTMVEDLSRATTSKVVEGSLKPGIPEARKVFLIPPLFSISLYLSLCR